MTPITWQAAVDDEEQRPLLQDILEAAVYDKLRSLKLLRYALWYKITSAASSFSNWKLIWVCRPQNHLTMGHVNMTRETHSEYFKLSD